MINVLWLIPAFLIGAAGTVAVFCVAALNVGEGESEERRLGSVYSRKVSTQKTTGLRAQEPAIRHL